MGPRITATSSPTLLVPAARTWPERFAIVATFGTALRLLTAFALVSVYPWCVRRSVVEPTSPPRSRRSARPPVSRSPTSPRSRCTRRAHRTPTAATTSTATTGPPPAARRRWQPTAPPAPARPRSPRHHGHAASDEHTAPHRRDAEHGRSTGDDRPHHAPDDHDDRGPAHDAIRRSGCRATTAAGQRCRTDRPPRRHRPLADGDTGRDAEPHAGGGADDRAGGVRHGLPACRPGGEELLITVPTTARASTPALPTPQPSATATTSASAATRSWSCAPIRAPTASRLSFRVTRRDRR